MFSHLHNIFFTPSISHLNQFFLVLIFRVIFIFLKCKKFFPFSSSRRGNKISMKLIFILTSWWLCIWNFYFFPILCHICLTARLVNMYGIWEKFLSESGESTKNQNRKFLNKYHQILCWCFSFHITPPRDIWARHRRRFFFFAFWGRNEKLRREMRKTTMLQQWRVARG